MLPESKPISECSLIKLTFAKAGAIDHARMLRFLVMGNFKKETSFKGWLYFWLYLDV